MQLWRVRSDWSEYYQPNNVARRRPRKIPKGWRRMFTTSGGGSRGPNLKISPLPLFASRLCSITRKKKVSAVDLHRWSPFKASIQLQLIAFHSNVKEHFSRLCRFRFNRKTFILLNSSAGVIQTHSLTLWVFCSTCYISVLPQTNWGALYGDDFCFNSFTLLFIVGFRWIKNRSIVLELL